MTTNKVRVVFLLGAAERTALEQRSSETGAPISELIRRAVSRYLLFPPNLETYESREIEARHR